MRCVLDTNVVVSGVLRPASKSGLLLDMALSGSLDSVASHELVAEWREVLRRPKFGLDGQAVDELVECLAAASSIEPAVPQSAWLSPDPKDQFLIDLAAATGAYLVTGNVRHLETYPRVLTPADAVEHLRWGRLHASLEYDGAGE